MRLSIGITTISIAAFWIATTTPVQGFTHVEWLTAIDESNKFKDSWCFESCQSMIARNGIPNPNLTAKVQYYVVAPHRHQGTGLRLYGGGLGSIPISGPNCIGALNNALAECSKSEESVGCRVFSSECSFDCQSLEKPESEFVSFFDNYSCRPFTELDSDDFQFKSQNFRLRDQNDRRAIGIWPGDSQMAAVKSVNAQSYGLVYNSEKYCESIANAEFRCYHDKMNDHLIYNRGWSGETHFATRCWVPSEIEHD